MRPADLPPPRDPDAPVARLVAELADHLGVEETAEVCVLLLRGADRADHLPELRYLAGRSFAPGDRALDPDSWADYWIRTWGARGLLHTWHDLATPAVVAGLADEHWRPAEMCLKVATRHDVAGAGDGAAALAHHDLPRVRAQAMRALAVVGDSEHVAVAEVALDDPDPVVRRHAARACEALATRLDHV